MPVLSISSCIRIVGFKGSGLVSSEERNVEGFNSVSTSAGINLYIEQTGAESLRIEAEDNIIPLIITEVSNDSLKISYKNVIFGGISTRRPVNIFLTVKDLNEIRLSSGANLESKPLKTEKLSVNLSSGANGDMIIDAKELEVRLSSGANLNISGEAGMQDIVLSSGVNYDAEKLISSDAKVSVSSGAVATINVDDELEVSISSGGSVIYYGKPQIISNISSGGTLKSMPQ